MSDPPPVPGPDPAPAPDAGDGAPGPGADAHDEEAVRAPVGGGVNPVLVIVAVVAVVALAFVALLAFSGGSEEADTSDQVVAEPAPPLAGETIKGEPIDLADYAGDWVVVNFFATWCPPCVAEHPELSAFSDSNAFDAKVVSVAFDEASPKVEKFFDEHGGNWPVLAQSEEIPLDWAVIGLPETFLVSPQGNVVKKYKGQVTAAGLESDIRANS